MKFTNFALLDPVMSVCVSCFIIYHAIINLKEIMDLFLEKAPCNISTNAVKEHTEKIDGVLDVHHIHLWSMDGQSNYATMHIVTSRNLCEVKKEIRSEMHGLGICHITIETETGAVAK